MKKKFGIAVGILFGMICLFCGNHCENFSNYAVHACAQVQKTAVNKQKEEENGLELHAKASYACDFETGTVIYAQNETQRLPIASMCKIMTLLLSFEALQEGQFTINDEIMVSEQAAAMGGSQVFLEANAKYPARELIKSIVVCSANDSCVAMAEKIAGNETLFVEKMNEKAKEIGANNTLFANCTGLPKEPQYSCAQDVAIMLKALLNYPQYYEFGKVWMDKFSHPRGRYTEITNTNKLVRFYDGCDGGKTGFTNQAGFCLAATAKRENMRIISVAIGADSSQNRFDDVRTMFDYAFANYCTTPIVEAGIPLSETVPVLAGKTKTIQVAPQYSAYDFVRRGEKGEIETETVFHSLRAPIQQGEQVGELIVYKNGVERRRVPLVALENVEKATWFDAFKEVSRNWNGK